MLASLDILFYMVKLHKVVSAEAAHLAARQVSYKIGFGLLRKEMELTDRDSIMSPLNRNFSFWYMSLPSTDLAFFRWRTAIIKIPRTFSL